MTIAAYTDKKHIKITSEKVGELLVREVAQTFQKLPNGAIVTELKLTEDGDLFIVLRTGTGNLIDD